MEAAEEPSNSFFNDLLEDIERNRLPLPTQPEIAMAIQEISHNPNVTIADLNDVISKDPALTARIIRIANSPLVRGRVTINTLKTAISRLGTQFVSNMAIGLAMEQLFCAKNKLIDQKMRQAWRHSGEVASVCLILANYIRLFPSEEAMLSGLMHDIGILPILTYAENNKDLAENLPELEILIQKFSAKLGESILISWQFTREIASVPLKLIDVYRESEGPDLADIVLVSKIHTLRNTQHPLALLDKTEIPSYARLKLSPTLPLDEIDELKKPLEEMVSVTSAPK